MDIKQLNEQRFSELFVKNIELARAELGLSQGEMAKTLHISLSSYKRIINRETALKGIYAIGVLYHLTGRFCFEYVECHDDLLDLVSKVCKLSEDDRRTVSVLVDHLLA